MLGDIEMDDSSAMMSEISDMVGESGPVLTKASPLPPQDGVGSDDHEGLLPPGPDSGQPDPEEVITSAERRSGHRSFDTASC